MGRVFISYKTEDRAQALRLRQAIAAATGIEVWWDQDLQTGGRWNHELDAALRDAVCVVALWSPRSVQSAWVLQEVAVAAATDQLVPAIIEECEVPEPYRSFQTVDLVSWDGSEEHPGFQRLCRAIGERAALHRPKPAWRPVLMAIVLAAALLGAGWAIGAAIGPGKVVKSPPPAGVGACRDDLSRLRTALERGIGAVGLRNGATRVVDNCKRIIDRLEEGQP